MLDWFWCPTAEADEETSLNSCTPHWMDFWCFCLASGQTSTRILLSELKFGIKLALGETVFGGKPRKIFRYMKMLGTFSWFGGSFDLNMESSYNLALAIRISMNMHTCAPVLTLRPSLKHYDTMNFSDSKFPHPIVCNVSLNGLLLK